MKSGTILIIEDDPAMLRALRGNFQYEGYCVETACDGERGLCEALARRADVILLDVMLPGLNGYEVCRRVRDEGIDIPIIMLTAKSAEKEIVLGLNLGADDYVTKPFSLPELLARVNAFMRRRRQAQPTRHVIGECVLDLAAQSLTRDGEEIPLTPKEFKLLALFVSRCGRALSRSQILKEVWGYDVFVSDRSVDRCVTTLRGKIEPDLANPTFIKTIRHVGYRFDPDGSAAQ